MDAQFFRYQPYDAASVAAALARYGSMVWAGGGPLYRDPGGYIEQTGTDPASLGFRQNAVGLYKLMRAGLIPWYSEPARQAAYRAHGQAVPEQGYGRVADQALGAGLLGTPAAPAGLVPNTAPAPNQLPPAGYPAPVGGHRRHAILNALGA